MKLNINIQSYINFLALLTFLACLNQVQRVVAQVNMTFEEADELGSEAYSLLVNDKVNVALAVYERILPVLAEQGKGERWTFHALDYSYCFIKKGDYKQALKILEDIKEQSTYLSGDDWLLGWLHNYTGQAYYYSGMLIEAKKQYEKALSFISKTDDPDSHSSFLNNYGAVLRLLGEYNKALRIYHKSLEMIPNDASSKLAVHYNGIALVYKDLNMYKAAKYYYERSLEFRKKEGTASQLATIYNNMAKLEELFGNYDQALVYHNKSLEYELEEVNPKRLVISYSNLADLYLKLGDIEKAKHFYSLSTQIFEKLNAPSTNALMWLDHANLNRAEGNYDVAENFYKKSLDFYIHNNQRNSAFSTYLQLAGNENHQDNFEKAGQYIDSALVIARKIESNELMARALKKKADWYAGYDQNDQAEKAYRKALEYASVLTPHQKIPLLVDLAKTLRKSGNPEAYEYAEQAIAHMETLRTRAGYVSSYRASVFKNYAYFYKQLALWYVEDQKQIDRAFYLIESAKSRAFIEDLELATSDFEQNLPDSLIRIKQEKQAELNTLYSKTDTLDNDKRAGQLRRNILNLEADYQAFLNQLGLTDIYKQKIKATHVITAQKAKEAIAQGTLVIEYAMLNDVVLIFTVTDETLSAQKIKLQYNGANNFDEGFENQVNHYIDSLSQKANIGYLKELGGQIANKLLHPVAQKIEQYENIIIVPDGNLAYLPFETLIFDKQYLIEKANIKYLPSLTAQTYLRQPKQTGKNTLLAMAGAQFDQQLTYRPKRQESLTALPYTIMEVDSIASLFDHKTIWKDKQVTEKRLKSTNLVDYQYIHFATHGIIDEKINEYSGLVLTGDEPKQGEVRDDGFLRMPEIFNLELDAEMVVLSACNTGRGEFVEGEGIMGLQRAFFTAGASSLVVSLWSIYDRSTALIMHEFYRNLQSEKEHSGGLLDQFLRWVGWDRSIPYGYKANAMRKAKLKMLQHPEFSHPVYWAPFVVLGR